MKLGNFFKSLGNKKHTPSARADGPPDFMMEMILRAEKENEAAMKNRMISLNKGKSS